MCRHRAFHNITNGPDVFQICTALLIAIIALISDDEIKAYKLKKIGLFIIILIFLNN